MRLKSRPAPFPLLVANELRRVADDARMGHVIDRVDDVGALIEATAARFDDGDQGAEMPPRIRQDAACKVASLVFAKLQDPLLIPPPAQVDPATTVEGRLAAAEARLSVVESRVDGLG